MKLGLENKKQTTWAAALGVLALVAVAWQLLPMFMGPSPQAASSPNTPAVSLRASMRGPAKPAKKVRPESLDPTLRLDLLASSEHTLYEGRGTNIFVKQQEVTIPIPNAAGVTDQAKQVDQYHLPSATPAPPIPLKFFGFASRPGEPKKVFLSQDGEVFVAGEGEIVNRRYKVVRITATSVEMQDLVYNGPTQNIPLTQG